jgi:regulator of CtrA degradation
MVALSSSNGGRPPVSFAERLAGSDAFKNLFREGMLLVEEAASYLDGDGRDNSKALPRAEALAYAAESMRLTTRLMQLASWLLLQRAVNEGEMTQNQAASETNKVRLSTQEMASQLDVFARLPERLKDLVTQSMRLQARIIHLDQLIYAKTVEAPAKPPSPLAAERERLRAAFGANFGEIAPRRPEPRLTSSPGRADQSAS